MLRTKNHGRQTADAARRTDIWITKSLPELSSGETKSTLSDKLKIGIKILVGQAILELLIKTC